MPLNASDIVWRAADLTSDATPSQNGGRMRMNSVLTSGAKNNLFPDVGEAERSAGSVRYRKAFVAVASTDQSVLNNVRLLIDVLTPGADGAVFYLGTAAETQDQLETRAPRPYGAARLSASSAVGATSIAVEFETASLAALQPIRAGDSLRVSAVAVGESGTEEYATVGSVSYSGQQATVVLSAGLSAGWSSGAVVSALCPVGDVQCAISTPVKSSALGTFDATKLSTTNKGATAQDWTLTFTSSSAYTLTGDSLGNVTTGSLSANLAPASPNGATYFSLNFSAFGGTWAAGDTVRFTTSAAAVPVWYRRDVPAGTESLGNDAISLAVIGETS